MRTRLEKIVSVSTTDALVRGDKIVAEVAAMTRRRPKRTWTEAVMKNIFFLRRWPLTEVGVCSCTESRKNIFLNKPLFKKDKNI